GGIVGCMQQQQQQQQPPSCRRRRRRRPCSPAVPVPAPVPVPCVHSPDGRKYAHMYSYGPRAVVVLGTFGSGTGRRSAAVGPNCLNGMKHSVTSRSVRQLTAQSSVPRVLYTFPPVYKVPYGPCKTAITGGTTSSSPSRLQSIHPAQ